MTNDESKLRSASPSRAPRSHGDGRFARALLASCGEGTVVEDGVRVFHPEHVHLGRNVYVGHDAMLKGYYKHTLVIGDGSWVGQGAFLHAAGGIEIGQNVGLGPYVKVLTSVHEEGPRSTPILHAPITFAGVVIEADADLGIGAIVLPGVRIGRGAQVGAGAVVTRDVPPYAVVAGNPAKLLRMREETP